MDAELKSKLEARACLTRSELRIQERAKADTLQRIFKYGKDKKMVEFAKGVRINVVKTKYGEIIKVGINLEEFSNNHINEKGYINFDILTAKDGKKYAEINNFKPTSNLATEAQIEDVPF